MVLTCDAAEENCENSEEVLFISGGIVFSKVSVQIASERVHAESRVITVHSHVFGDLIRQGQDDLHREFDEEAHNHQDVRDERHYE